MEIDNARVRASLGRASDRAATLLRGIRDVGVRMPNSDWTIGEAAAHVITSLHAYGGAAAGMRTLENVTVGPRMNETLARVNSDRIATLTERDPTALADGVLSAVETFLVATDGKAGDASFDWYGMPSTLAAMTGVMLGEILVHGWDMARTAGVPWPIAPEDADLIMLGGAALLPAYVNPETTRGVTASYDIRVRGGSRFGVRVADGKAVVSQPPAGPFDVHISADAVAMLLVSFGRIGLGRPIATGKLFAWGRRPLLGMKFKQFFLNP